MRTDPFSGLKNVNGRWDCSRGTKWSVRVAWNCLTDCGLRYRWRREQAALNQPVGSNARETDRPRGPQFTTAAYPGKARVGRRSDHVGGAAPAEPTASASALVI